VVSRLHARLAFEASGWMLHNESSTNPTVVNGRAMNGGKVLLTDGDLLEMGDVCLKMRVPDAARRRGPGARVSWHSDRGRRHANQDAVAVRRLPGQDRELAVLCDGMGSFKGGGIASQMAIDTLFAALTAGDSLEEGVKAANRAIAEAGEADLETWGMGTTLVGLLRDRREYWIANVGDSRAYRVDSTGISQLTHDHSFVAEAVAQGAMTIEEASGSPYRNAVTRVLGTQTDLIVDVFGPFKTNVHHRVILCTDGVHGVLSSEEILDILKGAPDVAGVARALVEGALLLGGEDNATAVVLEFD
jgi:protein phosphatase